MLMMMKNIIRFHTIKNYNFKKQSKSLDAIDDKDIDFDDDEDLVDDESEFNLNNGGFQLYIYNNLNCCGSIGKRCQFTKSRFKVK